MKRRLLLGGGSSSGVTGSGTANTVAKFTGASAVGNSTLAYPSTNILELKNSTNVQEFRIYGSTTGPKYVLIKHDGAEGIINTNGAYDMYIQANSTGWFVGSVTGEWSPQGDNAQALGAAANQVARIFTGTGMQLAATATIRWSSTSSFPMLKRNGTQIDVRLADDSAYTGLRYADRLIAAADATSITPNTDNADVTVQSNNQGIGTLTINADAGTPNACQSWILRIKSVAVQTFSWNAVYRGSTDLPLPTTTTGASKYDYYGFRWNAVSSTWDLVSKTGGF